MTMAVDSSFSTLVKGVMAPRLSVHGFSLVALNWNSLHEEALFSNSIQAVIVLYEYYEDYLDARVGPASAIHQSTDGTSFLYRDSAVLSLRAAFTQVSSDLLPLDYAGLDLGTENGLSAAMEVLSNCIAQYLEAISVL